MKSQARKLSVIALLVAAASVSLYAWSSSVWVSGSNNPDEWTLFGLRADGQLGADYFEGATYTQVKLNGFSGSCSLGFNDQGWCADNAHPGLIGWTSWAEQSLNVVPSGCYTAQQRIYINNYYQVTRYNTGCFSDTTCNPDQYGGDYTNCPNSPIVIATGQARKYKLTSTADGVYFDLDGDGVTEKLSWTEAGSDVAFLALDRNHNDTIDSGKELFGNFTLDGSPNGFAALRNSGEQNGDGLVDAEDALFASLVLWTDRNHNGYSEADELTPAIDVLDAIGLGYSSSPRKDGNGNTYQLEGWARSPEVGRSGRQPRSKNAWASEAAREFKIYDVYLVKE